jgi:hypothetical protein
MDGTSILSESTSKRCWYKIMFYLFFFNLILATYLGRKMDKTLFNLSVGGITAVFFFIFLPPTVHLMPGYETLKMDPTVLAGLSYIALVYMLMGFFYLFMKLPLPSFIRQENHSPAGFGNAPISFSLTFVWYVAAAYIIFSVCVDLFAFYVMGFKHFATFTPIDYGSGGEFGGARSLFSYLNYMSSSLVPPALIMLLALVYNRNIMRARISAWARLYFQATIILSLLANFLSGSRGLVMSVALGAFVVFCWNYRRERAKLAMALRYSLIVIAAVFALIFTTLIRHNHFSQVNSSQVDARQYRLNITWIPDSLRAPEFFVAMFSHYVSNSYPNYGQFFENREEFEPTYGFATIRGSGIVYRTLSSRFYRDINFAKWNNKEMEAQLGMLNQWRGWMGAYIIDSLFFLPFQFALVAFFVVYIPRIIYAKSRSLFYIYYPTAAIFSWSTLVSPITSFPSYFGPLIIGLAFVALKPSFFVKHIR